MLSIHHRPLALGIAALLALPLVAAAPASAGTDRYTSITSLPYTINTPGGYRLTTNLALSSGTAAITINCDNVVLDLDGFTIVNTTQQGAHGITAVGRSNVTIRNGTLRGFWLAMTLQSYPTAPMPTGIVVEDMKVLESKLGGIALANVSGAIVRRCNIANTISQDDQAIGIRVSGATARVIDNNVHRTKGNTSFMPTGIDVSGCDGSVVERNTISNPLPLTPSDYTMGINANGEGITVVGNRITGMYFGVSYSTAGTGPLRDNTVLSSIYPYTGGTDAGNNDQ
jgi:hypothetical protein